MTTCASSNTSRARATSSTRTTAPRTCGPAGDKEALREDLRRQIAPAEAVIALSSLYDAHKDLLTFQLLYAQASKKPVILMKPFGSNKAAPKAILDLASDVVEWDERALVDAIRLHARHEKTGRWDTIEFKLD